jgi:hypothetical protein
VQTPLTVDGLAVNDLTLGVDDGAEVFVGPFPQTTYNQQSGDDKNTVYVDPSSYDPDFKMAILTF